MAKQTLIAANPKFKGNYSGARAAYAAAMQGFIGKPVSAFVAHVATNPPSMPKTGKLAGKAEPVAGWVSFLTKPGQKNGGTPAYIIK